MKSRRKSLHSKCSSLEMSPKGTPLRQMSITEAFKHTKPKPFKMETKFLVSNVTIEISSDSDSETPPILDFEGPANLNTSGTIVDTKMLPNLKYEGSIGSADPKAIKQEVVDEVTKPTSDDGLVVSTQSSEERLVMNYAESEPDTRAAASQVSVNTSNVAVKPNFDLKASNTSGKRAVKRNTPKKRQK